MVSLWLSCIGWLAVAALLIVTISRIVQRALLYQPFVPSRQHEATPADKRYGIDFEDLSLRAADGTKLHGWLLKQPILSSSAPTVMFCHGNAGNISHALPFAKVLHGLGMNILLIDYRGFGRSAGRPNQTGLRMDAMAAYEYCCSCPGTINPEKIVIYGRSLGGAVALALAADIERRCRRQTGPQPTVSGRSLQLIQLQPPACVVIENSFTCVADLLPIHFGWPTWFAKLLELTVLVDRWDSAALLRDPQSCAIKYPLLLVSGLKDTVVPKIMMMNLYNLARHALEQHIAQCNSERYTEDNFWRAHSHVHRDAGCEILPDAPELLRISTGTHDLTWKNGGALYRSTLSKFINAHTASRSC